MYSTRRGRSFLTALLAVVCSLALAPTARAEVTKCKAAIIKASAAYVQARAKAIQKCKDGVVKDKITPFTTDCTQEAKASPAIAKAFTKMQDAIGKGCGGKDKICGGDATDEDGGTAIGFDGCPNIGAVTCSGNVLGTADCTGIAACLRCVGDAGVDQAINTTYGSLTDTNPKSADKTEKAVNKCQSAIGKAAIAFYAAKSKALSKCWDAVNKQKGNAPCPVPGDGKAAASIGKAFTKLADGIKKACAGKDKILGGSDVNADFTTAQIGFPASCPSVDPPGTEGPCGVAVSDLGGIIACLGCVTEFDVDCPDRAAASTLADYPAECGSAGPVATLTPTPTPTSTPSPPASCGDGDLDAPAEICDASAGGAGSQCPNVNNTLFPCNGLCTCACPSKVTFVGDPTDINTILDTGWTGIAHRAPVISNGAVTVNINCTSPNGGRPCGVCNVSGPIANPNAGAGQINNQRCTNDVSIPCTSDTPCLPAGTCKFFFGSILPLGAGGVGTCVINQFNAPISGTANVESGDATTTVKLLSSVFVSEVDHPCPRCQGDPTPNDGVKGGTCDSGTRQNLSCDANGDVPPRPDFGATSFDCPPSGSPSSRLPIDLSNRTGTVTRTLSAQSPNSPIIAGLKVMCSTCNNVNADPCFTSADCPQSGGVAGVCNGLRCIGGTNAGGPCTGASACPGGGSCSRPGAGALPFPCIDNSLTPGNEATCTDTAPVGDNEGTCPGGPSTQSCTNHPQRSCTSDTECDNVVGACAISDRNCFLDNGVVGGAIVGVGMADTPVNDTSDPTLAAVFCISPVAAPAVNTTAGLPGAGRVTIKGHAVGLP